MKILVKKTDSGFLIETNDNMVRINENTVCVGYHYDSKIHEMQKQII